MSDKLLKQLAELSTAQLTSIIGEISASSKANAKLVAQLIAAHNPKDLYKLLNRQLTAINNSKRFIGRYDAPELGEKIHQINQSIYSHLLMQAPDLALKLCKKLTEMDSIFERSDDSDAAISDRLRETYQLLDKAFLQTNTPPDDIAQYLFEMYTTDQYGCREGIVHYAKGALKAGADKPLEQLVHDNTLPDYAKCDLLQVIADARDDVDAFIRMTETHSNINDRDRLNIAERLNKAFRGDEAIAWLEQIPEDSHYQRQKVALLVEACRLEGDDNAARSVLWRQFEANLNPEDYLAYLKFLPKSEQAAARKKASELALSRDGVDQALRFFQEINEYETIHTLIVQQSDQLNGQNYSLYRKLSTTLAKNGFPLAATLLRRTLIHNVLARAQSAYYHYAVSDMRKASDFAAQVSDWRGQRTHEQFIQELQELHARKQAFWYQVNAVLPESYRQSFDDDAAWRYRKEYSKY